MDFKNITFEFIPFAGGLLVLVVLGFFVKPFLQITTDYLMNDGKEKRWVDFKGPGGVIGRFEGVIFYVSIIVGYPEFIGAWLIFKVAAKWDTWAHVVQMKPLSNARLDSEEFENRYRFGSWLLSRFLLGTLANIAIAGISVMAYLLVQKYYCAA